MCHVPRKPIEPFGKGHKKRRGKGITAGPESDPFLEPGREKTREPLGTS